MNPICKNHPDLEAKRKCYYCKAPICTDCQLNISHHIYCSKSCYYLQIAESIFNFFFMIFNTIIKIFQNKKIIRNMFDIILTLGLVIALGVAISNQRKVSKLSRPQPYTPIKIKKVPDKRHIDSLSIISPQPNTMILRNRFDIEGEAENNTIISLSANGKLIEAKVVKDRKFAFNDVLAKPGINNFIIRSMSEDGKSSILEEIKFKYGSPSLNFLSRDFVRGNRADKKIALTFDGGYLDNATEEILDILKQEKVKATMFLTAIYMKEYPELTRRIAADGHVIGNHTWAHPHLTTFAKNRKHRTLENITSELINYELLRTAELYKEITGNNMSRIWRAPFGEHNYEIRMWAADAGYRHIGWTVGRNWDEGMDTLDWVADKSSPAYRTANEIVEKILAFGNGKKNGANGTIILMHLGTERIDDYPHLKLPMIIDQLSKRGYQFVTILEML